MLNDKTASLHATFSVNGEVSDKDTRFLSVTVDVMNVGENLNGSYFSKEVVDENIESIKNTPILGFIEYDKYTEEADFKGHEYKIKRTVNGYEKVYVGKALGVVPESCSPRWFTKTLESGEEVECLRVDALMWEKFGDATGIMHRDIEKGQSMELDLNSVEGYDDENDGLFHFTKFKFNGCAILGDNHNPAMPEANVRINEVNFSMDEFSNSVRSELNDKFAAFTKLLNEKDVQGGVGNMPNSDFATVMQQFEDISLAVRAQETFTDSWGYECPRYYAADIQDSEVIVVDAQDNYHYYGVAFSMEGDKPVLDFACKKRKKVTYSDYEDGTAAPEGAFDFGAHISEIEKVFSEKVEDADGKVAEAESAKEDIEAEFEAVKSELEEIKPKYDELFAADEQRKADELNAEKDAKFGEYEEALSEVAEFAALKEKKDELSVEDIDKECALLYVKQNRAKANFSKSDSDNVVVGVIDDVDDAPAGYIKTERYGYVKAAR